MDFRKLRYALAVARERSFTRAAEKVHISQSAISEQVRLLEEEIGFSIFNRTGRGIEVSDLGRSFMYEAERVYNELLGLSDIARGLQGGGASFVLGMGSGVSQFAVPRALAKFAVRFPEVRLEIKVAPTRRIYDQLLDERIDAGITVENVPGKLPAGLVQNRISTSEMVLILPADHKLADDSPTIALESLAHAPLIVNELSVGYGPIVQSMFDDVGTRPNIVGVTDNIESMRIMVEVGMGLAILPKACLGPIAAGSRIQMKYLLPTRELAFCLLRRQNAMPKTRETQYSYLGSVLGQS